MFFIFVIIFEPNKMQTSTAPQNDCLNLSFVKDIHAVGNKKWPEVVWKRPFLIRKFWKTPSRYPKMPLTVHTVCSRYISSAADFLAKEGIKFAKISIKSSYFKYSEPMHNGQKLGLFSEQPLWITLAVGTRSFFCKQ